MSKKVCLTLLIISLATPISYASFVTFYPPKIVKGTIDYPAPVNRSAYKPYPGGRSDGYSCGYGSKSNNLYTTVGNDFKRASAEYNNDTRDFDRIASEF